MTSMWGEPLTDEQCERIKNDAVNALSLIISEARGFDKLYHSLYHGNLDNAAFDSTMQRVFMSAGRVDSYILGLQEIVSGLKRRKLPVFPPEIASQTKK